MQTRKDDSAFPRSYDEAIDEDYYLTTSGLTKREYFAAMAMQGLLSGPGLNLRLNIAECAVQDADRLIAELNKRDGI